MGLTGPAGRMFPTPAKGGKNRRKRMRGTCSWKGKRWTPMSHDLVDLESYVTWSWVLWTLSFHLYCMNSTRLSAPEASWVYFPRENTHIQTHTQIRTRSCIKWALLTQSWLLKERSQSCLSWCSVPSLLLRHKTWPVHLYILSAKYNPHTH